MKLKMSNILMEMDGGQAPQPNRRDTVATTMVNLNQTQARKGKSSFLMKLDAVTKKLKLTPREISGIFGNKNIFKHTPTTDKGSQPINYLQLPLDIAQSLITKFGDLERLSAFLEKSFDMNKLVGGEFGGFYVPEMQQVKQAGPVAQTPQQDPEMEEFSRQIDQD